MDSQRITLLNSLAQIIADYGSDRKTIVNATHVNRWLKQFEAEDQLIILHEMNFIMKRFYFSRLRVKNCIRGFVQEIIGNEQPAVVLSRIKFLNTLQSGNSQQAILTIMDEILRDDYGLSLADTNTKTIQSYVYMDDAIYTGNKLRHDQILKKIHSSLPSKSDLIIYVVAAHRTGYEYAIEQITSLYNNFHVRLFASLVVDDRRFFNSNVEILWPEPIVGEPLVDTYTSNLQTEGD